jgi:dTDP-4-dehydrorhamnose reductase
MRVLVTGANGQLGHDVMASWGAAGDEMFGTDLGELDITRRDQVHDLLGAWRPDVVVNCAAWTAVDACEGDSERAHLANGFAVRWVAEACDAIGARLVHISTDYVFDGTKPSPYVETDEPNPQSVYGASKLMGEREALDIGAAANVVRTSWVCGAHGSNMVRTVQRLVAENKPMAFVTDQVGHPTFTADLAPALRRLVVERVSGLVHVTNSGTVSWYEFVREVVRLMGADPDQVRPITTAELDPPRPARRPANSVLDNAVWRSLGWPMTRDFREPLAELLAGGN